MSLLKRLRTRWSSLTANSYPWPAVDITLPGGRHLHLVGSIHMGTRNMSPLHARLREKIVAADALLVEADIREGTGGGLPAAASLLALRNRIAPEQFERLERRADELGISLETLAYQPLWQVALVLQANQAQRLGLRGEYGIDYQMLDAAQEAQVRVMELEGAQAQLSLLETLPDEGLGLLEDTLEHWHTNARLLQLMVSWWLDAPPRQQTVTLPATFSDSLYDVLMHQRNHRWCDMLRALPPGRYVVAVGALHLYGDGNLPALLKKG